MACNRPERGEGASPLLAAEFQAAISRTGELLGREDLWPTHDGRVIAVRENIRVVRGPSGAVLYYEGTVDDITETKAAEAALAQANAKLEAVSRHSPLAVLAADDRGKVTSWNPSAEQMFGWDGAGAARGSACPSCRSRGRTRRLAGRIAARDRTMQSEEWTLHTQGRLQPRGPRSGERSGPRCRRTFYGRGLDDRGQHRAHARP